MRIETSLSLKLCTKSPETTLDFMRQFNSELANSYPSVNVMQKVFSNQVR